MLSAPATSVRVLIVNPWPTFWSMGGGAGCSDEYETLRGFLAAGFDVHYVLPAGDPDPAADPLTARARFTRFADPFRRGHWMPAPGKRLWWYPRFAWRSAAVARRVAAVERPHVVFGYTPYGVPAALAAARVARAASVVKLFGVRDLVADGRARWRDWYTNAEAMYAFRAPLTRLLALDDGTRADVAAQREGTPAARFLFWPNGANAEWGALDPAPLRAEVRARLGVGDDVRVVVSLSRMVGYKRVDRAVRAVPALLAARGGAPTLMVFAGDGPERARCEALAAELGVAAAVRFVGAVPHAEVPAWLAASDAFVATSEQTNAGIPTCEALIMGVPVVAVAEGATASMIRDGEAGFTTPPDDAASLAARLAEVLAAPAGSWRERARAVAARHCVSWADRVQREVDLVRTLAAEVDACRAR